MPSYDQPEFVDKRPRYFDGQFLREQDFIDEQIYHIDRQRRTARMFLTPGVAAGLGVARDAAGTLAVEPGTALDQTGRLIVLKDRTVVPVALRNVSGATLQIFWRQEESDRAEGGGSAGNTRWYEKPGFEVVAPGGTPQNRDAVMLAGFDIAADGTIALRTGSRAIASVRSLGTLSVTGTSTFSGNVGIGGNPSTHTLTVGTDPSADIWRSQLAIHGSALRTEARLAFTTTLADNTAAHTAMIKAVVPAENGGDLVFQTRDQAFGTLGERLRIRNNGNVGIGTAAPGSKLDVQGGDIRTSGKILWNNGKSFLSDDQGGAIELGSSTQTGARPYIDFHFGTGTEQDNNIRIQNTADRKLAILGGDLGIGTDAPGTRLAIAGASSTVNVEVTDFVRLIRPGVSGVKNSNSAGFAVGAHELGIAGRSRLDIKLAGAPVEGNRWGEIPDTTVMTLQADGNIGLGTATPKARLDIAGDVSIHGKHAIRGYDTWLRLNQDGAFTSGVHTPGLLGPAALNVGGVSEWLNPGYGHALIAGNLGIGTATVPGVRLQIGSNGGAVINGIMIGTDVPGRNIDYEYESIGVTGASMNLRLQSPNSIVLHSKTHILANLGVGPNHHPDSIPNWSGGGIISWDLFYYGSLSKQSTVRVKEHVQPLTGVLDRIGHLNPVQFDYRDTDRPQREGIGFIAEELHEVFPECATGDDDFFAWGVNESALHALAIAGIQELARKVKLLEHRLGQPARKLQAEQRPSIAILREGVDSSGTGEAYVTVRFSARHAALDQVETVRTLRLPPDVPREQFLQAERERWLDSLDLDQ